MARQKRIKKYVTRKGGSTIVATDSMLTGAEPDWTGWESWSVEKFMHEHARAFRFYTYYSSARDMKKDLYAWMADNGYSKKDIAKVRKAPDNQPGIVTCIFARCMNNGMPALHPEAQNYIDGKDGRNGEAKSDEIFVRENIAKVLNQIFDEPKSDDVAEKPKGVSPRDRLAEKMRETIMIKLEEQIDALCEAKNAKNVKFDLYREMHALSIPLMGCSTVRDWINKQLTEVQAAYDKTDKDLVEGYSFLSRTELRSWVKFWSDLLADLVKYEASKKTTRKPRKSAPTADKMTKYLKYMDSDAESQTKSIPPEKIIGSQRLLVYNTKYKAFIDFRADGPNGFTIQGTTLKGVDLKSSQARRLRKPDEFLPIALSRTERQIAKAWDALTTKPWTPANSRINANMILLRVF